MAKLSRGRLDGLNGMRSLSSVELVSMAAELERAIDAPGFSDDPKWQRRWVRKLRALADAKERAREHKQKQ